MIFLSNAILYNLLGIFVALLAITIAYFKWSYNYWTKRGMVQADPTTPFGNLGPVFRQTKSFGETFKEIYDNFKAKGLRHVGAYGILRPLYMPIDLEIVKDIMTTNFSHFVNRGIYINEEKDPLSGHLFNLEDAKWRNVRAKLTPTFTSGKMKMMFETLADCSRELVKFIDASVGSKQGLEIKDVVARYTTDIIGSVAFGLECNSLKNPDAEFRKYGRMTFENNMWQNFKGLASLVVPMKYLRILNFKATRNEVERFFMDVVHKNIEYRETNKVQRKDFFQLLLQLKNRGKIMDEEDPSESTEKIEVKLTPNEVAAHSFVFFLAGFETTSTTITWALYELAKNLKIQKKLRNEINTVLTKYDGKYTYEAFMEMKYMDQVINETLRKYPPVAALFRICTKDYTVPGTSVVIEKDNLVMLSILGIHHDPEYYSNPEKFDPERFSDENKKKIPPFAWIPFGEGPRICIGLRFGMMQARVGLASVIKGHQVTLHKNTKEPVQATKESFIMAAEGGVWLNINKI